MSELDNYDIAVLSALSGEVMVTVPSLKTKLEERLRLQHSEASMILESAVRKLRRDSLVFWRTAKGSRPAGYMITEKGERVLREARRPEWLNSLNRALDDPNLPKNGPRRKRG